ncbi:MAG: DEAD/DEAH box helicase family protein [Bacteroidales bacterium]|jgi:type I restriction enzyme R subunit
MTEEVFHNHICEYLKTNFGYRTLSATDIADKEFFFIENHLTEFIQTTQPETWKILNDEYFGSDTGRQIIKTIKEELQVSPLWLVIRNGISLKGKKIYLYTPRPRSNNSAEQMQCYKSNIFALKKEFYFADNTNEAIDLVLYLNGLPIITTELKHHGETGEASTYEDAIIQYIERRHEISKIFSLPFAHFAADTDEVRVATNPTNEENFQPFNTGLENKENPEIPKEEYPVWHLYGQAFSPEYISDFIEYFLIYVSANAKKQKPAFTIMPRFHQLRSTRNLTSDLLEYAETHDVLGKKYLINHSPGSGKTLTISWMAERLDSLHKATTNEKVIDIVFILTDRKSLDTNVKDDLEKFVHLHRKMVFTSKASEVLQHIKSRTNIIVTTIQKFNYVQKELKEDESLKKLKVAFLIDEAHRSQGGKMGKNVRTTFANESIESEEEQTFEDEAEEIFKQLDISRQVYIAFTATPVDKTLKLFGTPFDIYTEDEAIKEGYILDVSDNIISYKTLYHLNTTWVKPDDKLYPEGIITKLLRDIAYEDESIIEYKSTVIIEHFEKEVKKLLEGKAKVMVVATSRQAGYNYYLALKTIIDRRKLGYKALFAFTDFIDKVSKMPLTEANVNDIKITDETPIEKYFEKDEYRILIVANKFQQGFDEPLLCAMYLDKIVKGINAVQTISRLNRKYQGKNKTTVIDFTNNAKEIFEAFSKYRKGAKVRATEPDPDELQNLYAEIMSYNVFTQDMISQYIETAKERNDSVFAAMSLAFRLQFEKTITDKEERKKYVNLLLKYVKKYNFFAQFIEIPETLVMFAIFADLVAGKLFKLGAVSTLKKSLESVTVEKIALKYIGKKINPNIIKEPREGKHKNIVPPKATIDDVIEEIRRIFKIEEGDEIIIKEIFAETMQNNDLINLIFSNKENTDFLQLIIAKQLRQQIIDNYKKKGMLRKTREPQYKDNGGIFDLLVQNIIRHAIYKTSNN